MAKIALTTVGCRLNQYETEQIAAELIRRGLDRVAYSEPADLYILNTCTVTGRADADCRNLISRAYRKNPEAVIVVVGCYVVADRERVAELTGVDLVVGNDNKFQLPDLIKEKYPKMFATGEIGMTDSRVSDDLPVLRSKGTSFEPVGRNRAMVKIGDGCDQGCSYCIVPSVRGGLVSYPSLSIIREVRTQVEDGYHEVVLTAVHIGKYCDDGLNLAGLAGKILAGTSLARLRFSSLEPNELDNDLLELVSDHPRICRHLHLPLQSGSDRILQIMRRPYNRRDYLNQIKWVKNANPAVTIGCDLIVGFPGETEKDFAESLEILDSGYIDYAHVFSYSDRPGTPASEMPDKVDHQIIKERNLRARDISRKVRIRQMYNRVGDVLAVISEGKADCDGKHWGITDNYLKVKLPPGTGGGKAIINIKAARLIETETGGAGQEGGYLEGELTA